MRIIPYASLSLRASRVLWSTAGCGLSVPFYHTVSSLAVSECKSPRAFPTRWIRRYRWGSVRDVRYPHEPEAVARNMQYVGLFFGMLPQKEGVSEPLESFGGHCKCCRESTKRTRVWKDSSTRHYGQIKHFSTLEDACIFDARCFHGLHS